jgi:hypothetical protein
VIRAASVSVLALVACALRFVLEWAGLARSRAFCRPRVLQGGKGASRSTAPAGL